MRAFLGLWASAALAAALVVASPSANAGGTITTAGSAIDSGTAPVKGTVTVDPNAPLSLAPALPSVGSLGSIGTISGSIPAFVAAGGAGPFVATPPTQTLPGGVYSFSTFNVPQGTTLTYTGAVTIQTAGDVQIDGLVTTTAAGAGITFVCGGNFRIISHAGAITTGVSTTGLTSPISVDANGTISAITADTSSSWIDAASGPVTLMTHSAGSLMAISSIAVRARSAGNTIVQSSAGLAMPAGTTIRADLGDVTVQSYNGPVLGQAATLTAGNNLLVEASALVNLNSGSQASGTNTVTITAFGGSVAIAGSTFVSQTGGTGDITVRASNAVSLAGSSSIQVLGTGNITVTAFSKTGEGARAQTGSDGIAELRVTPPRQAELTILARNDRDVALLWPVVPKNPKRCGCLVLCVRFKHLLTVGAF